MSNIPPGMFYYTNTRDGFIYPHYDAMFVMDDFGNYRWVHWDIGEFWWQESDP